jgi:serine/threonine-protein kinase
MAGGNAREESASETGFFESEAAGVLSIGEFEFDTVERRLTRQGEVVPIQRRPLELLLFLAAQPGRMVSREELLDAFWPNRAADESLTRCISTLRKALGDTNSTPRYLETAWGEGYRLIARTRWNPGRGKRENSGETAERAALRRDPAHRNGWNPAAWSWKAWLLLGFLVTLSFGVVMRYTPAPESGVDFVAVLPISGTFEEEWLGAMLTDHLIETIAKIEGVAVIARGSTAQFTPDADPRDVGRRLGVDAVLLTRFAPSVDGVRLQSQLVSARDGSVLWSFRAAESSSTTNEEEILDLADAVARHLWANLQLGDRRQQVEPEAYREYLRGRYFWNQRSRDGLEAAIHSFSQALEMQPAYVDALAGLADAWLLMPLYGAVPPQEAIPRARSAAERVLALDPEHAHADAVLGVVSMQFDWDWAEAEARLQRAITLNPNDSSAVQWLGELHCYRKQFDECRRYYGLARALDPLSPVIRMLQGSPALYSGQFEAAVTGYQETLRELPDFKFTLVALGHALGGMGAWNRAAEAYREALPHVGLAIVGGPLAFVLARGGRTDEAQAILEELEQLAGSQYVPPSKLAVAHLGLGNRSRSLEYLWDAVDVHDDRLVYLAVDPYFRALQGDPEFRKIVTRLGLDSTP